MNENNGLNTQPVVPVQPVQPVAPTAPVAPAAPVPPVAPVQPVAPVPPVPPVPPAPPAQPAPAKNNSKIIIIICVVIILVLIGVILFLVFGKKEVKGEETTTTTTVTTTTDPDVKLTTKPVTTIANTTTVARTTKPTRQSEPVQRLSKLVVGKWDLTIPDGFEGFEKSGFQQIVNSSKGASVMFVNVSKDLGYIKEHIDQLYGNLQANGFDISDVKAGEVLNKEWILIELNSPNIGKNHYVYAVTDLDNESVIESYILLTPTSTLQADIIKILSIMVKSKTQNMSGTTTNSKNNSNYADPQSTDSKDEINNVEKNAQESAKIASPSMFDLLDEGIE